MATEAHPHPIAGRTTLVFCVDKLAARDATLFKSFVRLLDHRTQQKWVCGQQGVDLHVVPEGTTAPRDEGKPASAVLTVGTSPRYLDHYLSLPIRADELETELNQLGALIGVQRPAPVMADAHDSFRLLRWPPPSLLGSSGHVRLATLMSVSAVSLQTAQTRTGLSASACARFFDDLSRVGLLRTERVAPDAAPRAIQPRSDGTAHVQQGLLSMIRNRLGLVGSRA